MNQKLSEAVAGENYGQKQSSRVPQLFLLGMQLHDLREPVPNLGVFSQEALRSRPNTRRPLRSGAEEAGLEMEDWGDLGSPFLGTGPIGCFE
jgi:hypothetical protein